MRTFCACLALVQLCSGCALSDLDHLSEGEVGGPVASAKEPSCPAGTMCAEPPPAGWDGPVALYLGAVGDPLPGCDRRWPTQRFSALAGELVAGAAECSACSCRPPADPCTVPWIHVFAAADCKLPLAAAPVDPGVCYPSGAVIPSGYVDPSVSIGAACTASEAVLSKQAPTATAQALVCEGAAVGAACGDSAGICMPMAEPPFGARVCVLHEGEVECPEGSYADKSVLHLDVIDTRHCAPCSCGAANVECEGSVSLFATDDECSPEPAMMGQADGGCVNVGMSIESYRYDADTRATCDPPRGGELEGDVTSRPVTVCCTGS